MLASVIVPARNAGSTLGACLAALQAQQGITGSWEVIVVDDGSCDDTAAVAGAFSVRLVVQPPRGAAAARNAGARAATGDVLAFTDADCRPRPGWLAGLLAPFIDERVSGVQGLLASDQAGLMPRVVQAEYADKQAHMLARGQVTFADTASAAYRADVFRAAGGFREDLAAVEDTELAFRLAAAGHRLVMAPDAVVYHQHPESLAAYARRKLRFGTWGAVAYGAFPERVVDDTRTPGSMRLQLLLAPVVLTAGALAPVSRSARWTAALATGAFCLTVLPFARRAARTDPAVAAVAPAVFFVRAVALGTGLALGFARVGLGRPGSVPPPPTAAVGEVAGD